MKYKILFNCTSNVTGGGVKNSAIFIKNALTDSKIDWFFAVSKEVHDVLIEWKIVLNNIYVFESSPSRSLTQRKKLFNLSESLNISLVYTMAGPAYVKFKVIHVLGLSNPYLTHATLDVIFIKKSFFKGLKKLLLTFYQYLKARDADYFIFQTETSKKGFMKRFFKSERYCKVISNAVDQNFLASFLEAKKTDEVKKDISILCPAVPYPHKALHLIPKIAYAMKINFDKTRTFKFLLTINVDSEVALDILTQCKKLGVLENIICIGEYNYSNVVEVYNKADLVFVPSLLETFSATYLEAIAARRPLCVVDKSFAKDICGLAAIYLNPLNSKETAQKLNDLIENDQKQKSLIAEGNNVLNKYGTQEERYKKICQYLLDIYKIEKVY